MPVYTQQILPLDPVYIQDGTFSARDDRLMIDDFVNEGAVEAGAFLVTHVTALTVQVAAGSAYVKGENVSNHGTYRQRLDSAIQIAVGSGHATLPRLDQIILRIMDTDMDSSGFREARIEVVPGTPTSGATLGNRLGAANLATLGEASKSVLLLADVLVPAAASSISGANIGDKRTFAALNPRNNFVVSSTNQIWFGTLANLYSPSSGILKTDSAFHSAGEIAARSGTAAQAAIGLVGPGSQAGISLGSAGDSKLWRGQADSIDTDDRIVAGGGFRDGGKVINSGNFSNTTTESDIFNVTMPAGWMAGGVFFTRMACQFLNNTGAGHTFRLRIYLAGTLAFDDTSLSIATNGAARGVWIDFFILPWNAETILRGGGLVVIGGTPGAVVGIGALDSNALISSPFTFAATGYTSSAAIQVRATITLSAANANLAFYYETLAFRR